MAKVGIPTWGKLDVLATTRKEHQEKAQAALRLNDENDLLIGVRVWTDDVQVIVDVPLRELLFKVLSEMKPTAGTDARTQAALSQLLALGQQLSRLGQPQPPSVPDMSASELVNKLYEKQVNGRAN